MTVFRTMLIAMAATVGFSAAAAMPAMAAGYTDCLTDRQVQKALEQGQIKSWPKIRSLAGIPPDEQEVSEVRVCLIDGVPYYTVNLVSADGEASKVAVSAIDGSS